MAKALLGHLHGDPRDHRLVAENARLRQRVADLEALCQRLSAENDRLVDTRAAALLDSGDVKEMQPA